MFLFFSKKRKENYVTACNFGRGDFLEKNLVKSKCHSSLRAHSMGCNVSKFNCYENWIEQG